MNYRQRIVLMVEKCYPIGEQTGVARNTIKKYLLIFRSLNIPWNKLNKLSDSELEKHFIKEVPKEPSERRDQLHEFFPKVDKGLKRPGVTRGMLWEELSWGYKKIRNTLLTKEATHF